MSSLAIAQYFCLIDFLREFPLLIFIKILYFHNPDSCGTLVNIGHALDQLSNQAVVLVTRQPLSVTRTLYVNSCSLGLGVGWCLGSIVMMRSGQNKDKVMVWPWVLMTVAVCTLDLIATVIFINDTFYTKTLADIMTFIGATASGVRNIVVDTRLTAWTMVLLYSRFIIIFVINVMLVILVVLNRLANKTMKESEKLSNSMPEAVVPSTTTGTPQSENMVDIDLYTPSLPRHQQIPRAFYSKKKYLVKGVPDLCAYNTSGVYSQPTNETTVNRDEVDHGHTNHAIVDQLQSTNQPSTSYSNEYSSRQPATAELTAQLPWTYIPLTMQPVQPVPDEVPPPLKGSLIKKRKEAILSSLSSHSVTTPTFKWDKGRAVADSAFMFILPKIIFKLIVNSKRLKVKSKMNNESHE
ncbi:uncharacterized protein LOC123705588 isoform X2 [Colias croceus]|nr:uncharacterized protein LOC123705588 isoform X2 [Colias croceus]